MELLEVVQVWEQFVSLAIDYRWGISHSERLQCITIEFNVLCSNRSLWENIVYSQILFPPRRCSLTHIVHTKFCPLPNTSHVRVQIFGTPFFGLKISAGKVWPMSLSWVYSIWITLKNFWSTWKVFNINDRVFSELNWFGFFDLILLYCTINTISQKRGKKYLTLMAYRENTCSIL